MAGAGEAVEWSGVCHLALRRWLGNRLTARREAAETNRRQFRRVAGRTSSQRRTSLGNGGGTLRCAARFDQRRHHAAAFHAGGLLHHGDVVERVQDLLQHFASAVVMGVFASAEDDVELDLVAAGEKAAGALDLDVDVVLAGFGAEAELFELRAMSLGASGALLPLIADLAVVHDAADGRPGVGSDLDEIESGFAGQGQRLGGLHVAEHLAVGADDLDGRDADAFVHARLIGGARGSQRGSGDVRLQKGEGWNKPPLRRGRRGGMATTSAGGAAVS